jgi:GNAT superfamily N-acetyltransferase
MEAELQTDVVVRPVRDVDAEALGRVHATCWHETYDHLISRAALESVSARRMAELWTHWMNQGPDYVQYAALVNGEIVGFAGAGPARDDDAPRPRELYFLYLLAAWHGTGIGQRLFDAVVPENERGVPLGRGRQSPRPPVLSPQRIHPRRRLARGAVPG